MILDATQEADALVVRVTEPRIDAAIAVQFKDAMRTQSENWDGKIIYEAYPRQLRIDQTHTIMSSSKTLTAMILARLIEEGKIGRIYQFRGQYLFNADQDLNPFDRVYSQLRFQILIQSEHFRRVTGTFTDYIDNAGQQLFP